MNSCSSITNQDNDSSKSPCEPPSQSQPNEMLCQCGQGPIEFFIVEPNKHLCEKCAVNEIYKNESYERVVEKVWNKVKNIMKIRAKVCQIMHTKNHQIANEQCAHPSVHQIDPQVIEKEINIERLNLFYDLLHIEIEKLRRKSIDEINSFTIANSETIPNLNQQD